LRDLGETPSGVLETKTTNQKQGKEKKMNVKKHTNSIGQVTANVDLTPTVQLKHFRDGQFTWNLVLWKQSDHTIKRSFDTLLKAYQHARRLDQ